MSILVVNAGSSTLKLTVVGDDDRIEAELDVDPWDGASASEHIDAALRSAEEVHVDIVVVGHRFVHGGDAVGASQVTQSLIDRLHGLSTLAPLHQPRSLAALADAQQVLPNVPHVACFDTSFHLTMAPRARTYALPQTWRERWPLERTGFHGLSHAWAGRRASEMTGQSGQSQRVVSCHLGAGASLCAILDGHSVDTSMGYTPLDGLVMATRSGSIDPGLILWLILEGGLEPHEILDGIERRGGLAGLSGTTGDMRAVLAALADGDQRAELAFDVYIHRLRREIAAMAAALGGVDALVFTGGVGEHSAQTRAAAVDGLKFLGVSIDATANSAAVGDTNISGSDGPGSVLIVASREDLEIARQVRVTSEDQSSQQFRDGRELQVNVAAAVDPIPNHDSQTRLLR